jgi:transposase
VAREIGVGAPLLGRWVAQQRAHTDHPPGPVDAAGAPSWTRLRVKNAEQRMDREFLKKAAAFFATENQNR